MNASAIYAFTPPIALLLLTAYLLYVRANRQILMHKYRPGTPERKKYTMLLDPHLLILVILFTFYFVTDAVFRIYGMTHRNTYLVVSEFVALMVTTGISVGVIYDWIFARKKRT